MSRAEVEKLAKSNKNQNTAATAYHEHPSASAATLVFLVPVVSLLSCIPAAMAFTRAHPTPGTFEDAEFYQQLSNSLMQLLGLATLVWPTVFQARLAQHPWIFTWLLAGVSAICSVVAVSLYVLAPAGWSGVIAFGGAVAQALVTLQLIREIARGEPPGMAEKQS